MTQDDVLSKQDSLQATRTHKKPAAQAKNIKCVYVIHREDSKNWVMNHLKPILNDELNIDMSTEDNFIPGMTKAQARSVSVKNAQKIIVVFSKQSIEDQCSNEHKWFEYDLSKAKHKDPNPQTITVIPILHGDISCGDLPESVEDQISLRTDHPLFKNKIKESILS